MDARLNKARREWCEAEDLFILGAVRRFGTHWEQIAAHLPERTEDAVRNRWHRLRKQHAAGQALPTILSTASEAASETAIKEVEQMLCEPSDRSARLPWTAKEDLIIAEGVKAYGCKWRLIAAQLPGRSDSSARNRWLRLCKEAAQTGEPSAVCETASHGLTQPEPTQNDIKAAPMDIEPPLLAMGLPVVACQVSWHVIAGLPIVAAIPICN